MRHPHACLAAGAFMVLCARAHMTLRFPAPFASSNSPLDPSGADFPCKPLGGAYQQAEATPWRAGETKTVSFKGSAVHGGGSCQFSLTTDKEPSKQSRWKVIHSVIGGCPSNASTNFEPDPDGELAATFPVTLPEDTPNGEITLAWSWLNKKGLREFYMSCAPLVVSGGSEGTPSGFHQLPDMFVANLPASSCATGENFDFAYPDPGASVVTGAAAAANGELTGDGCATMTRMGAGAGAGAGVEVASAPVKAGIRVSEQMAATENSGPASPTAGGSRINQASSPVTASPGPTLAVLGDPPQSLAPGRCVPCSGRATLVCIGDGQFGVCAGGCAVPQDLAPGTTCSDGAIA